VLIQHIAHHINKTIFVCKQRSYSNARSLIFKFLMALWSILWQFFNVDEFMLAPVSALCAMPLY